MVPATLVHPQVLFCFQGPVRLARKFPADERQIGVTAGDDLIGVVGIRSQPYRAGSDLYLVTNTPGAGHLWTGVLFYATPAWLLGSM